MPSPAPSLPARQRSLSELECFILGLVWKYGPCTAYALRQQLQSSPSTQWSGSAGAIYPLVRRLEKAGLLKSRSAGRGKRASHEYAITARGEAALRHWIGPPLPTEALTVAHDPLRSRVRFLSLLSAPERRAWIDAALQTLHEVARRVRSWEEANANDPDPFVSLLTRSGLLDVRARRNWLRQARRITSK